MKRNRSILILLIFVIVGIGVFVAYTMYNKPHTDISSLEGEAISAVALYAAFEQDEAAAMAQYAGADKIIEVSGILSQIVEEDGNVFAELAVPDAMMGGVRVSVDPRYANEAKALNSGAEVSFRGLCAGYIDLTGVIVKDGVLLNPQN